MCGIAGVAGWDGRPARSDWLDAMLDTMTRRGPDGSGTTADDGVAIGMRRLAILDLARGRQPFFSEDGRVAAVMNGEIYNFRAVRRDLERRGVAFRTDCDAEVIPHAYRHYGVEPMLERLDGMFAIAIHDREHRTLHLARDRFGEKPLFFASWPGGLAFASQLPTLCLLGSVDREVDPVALRQYLAMHFVAGPRTILRGVRRVPAGHRLALDLARGELRVRRWWDPLDAPAGRAPSGLDEAVERVRGALDEAVASRLVSDVPLGVFLSGGIDSSAVAAAMAACGSRLETFSIGFEDAAFDESEHARAVAAHLGSRHHHFRFDLRACRESLDEALAQAGEPIGDPACLPVYLLSREARKHVKVVLSGEGADEIFGGYGYYPDPGDDSRCPRPRDGLGHALRRLLAARAPAPPFLRADHTTPSGFPLLTTPAERDVLAPGAAGDADPWLEGVAGRAASQACPLRGAQLADLETWLADDLLVKFDQMTMAASLEGRAPYLAPALVRLGLALSASHKRGDGEAKRVLRRAVADRLPATILTRRKQGFVLPMQEWLAGPLRGRLLDELDVDRGDGLEVKRARELVEADLAAGAARSRLLYALLAYRIWAGRVLGSAPRLAA